MALGREYQQNQNKALEFLATVRNEDRKNCLMFSDSIIAPITASPTNTALFTPITEMLDEYLTYLPTIVRDKTRRDVTHATIAIILTVLLKYIDQAFQIAATGFNTKEDYYTALRDISGSYYRFLSRFTKLIEIADLDKKTKDEYLNFMYVKLWEDGLRLSHSEVRIEDPWNALTFFLKLEPITNKLSNNYKAGFHLNLSQIYQKLNDFDFAYEQLKKAKAVYPMLIDEAQTTREYVHKLAFQLERHKRHEAAIDLLQLLKNHFADRSKKSPRDQVASKALNTLDDAINRNKQALKKQIEEKTLTLRKEQEEKRNLEISKIVQEYETESFILSLENNTITIHLSFPAEAINAARYRNPAINSHDHQVDINCGKMNAQEIKGLLNFINLDVSRHLTFMLAEEKGAHTTAQSQPTTARISETLNEKFTESLNLNQKNDQPTTNEKSSFPKKTKQKTKKEEKQEEVLGAAELLGFSKEFNDKTIYPLDSTILPQGSYYMFFDSSKAEGNNIDTGVLDKHKKCIDNHHLGHGIKFVKGMKDTFKTHIRSNLPAGDFRMFSRVVGETTVNGKRRVLLAFDQPHDHKSQAKLPRQGKA